MSEVKQVIVIRKDLKMRRGKEIAQGAHASMAWLAERTRQSQFGSPMPKLTSEQLEWISNRFTKICLQVDSEKELLDVYQAAKENGLTVHLITDAGATEFNGVPTKTCLAIGPNKSSEIDKVTGKLKLY